jgi:hypothetical protein
MLKPQPSVPESPGQRSPFWWLRVRGPQGAAALLGLKPTTLESRIKKLGLQRPR